MKQPVSGQRLQYSHRLCQVVALQLPGFLKIRRLRRKVRHQSARELVDGRRPATRCVPQLVHTLRKPPCLQRRYHAGNASSSLSYRTRPALARHTGERSCVCPYRSAPIRRRARAPCQRRVSRPCGPRARQFSAPMRCRHRPSAVRVLW